VTVALILIGETTSNRVYVLDEMAMSWGRRISSCATKTNKQLTMLGNFHLDGKPIEV